MDLGGWWGPWWGSGFSIAWVFCAVFLIFMVAMIVMMFRRCGGICMPMRRGSAEETRETPRQILDRRLASGELTLTQYDTIRRDLDAARAGR